MKLYIVPFTALLFIQAPAGAQSVGRMLDGLSHGNVPQRTMPPGSFAHYLRAATDQGIKALEELADAFPPEKVAHLKELTNNYRRATAQTGEIDGEAFTIATDAATEMAKLENDWNSYKKEARQKVQRAHARIGLMLSVDAYAATAAQKEKQILQAQATSLGHSMKDVFHRGGANSADNDARQLQTEIKFLGVVVGQIPTQQKSFTAVQHIATNIAQAEHFQLRADPPKDSITTTSDVEKTSRDIDTEFPDK